MVEHELLGMENDRHELDKLLTEHLNKIELTTVDAFSKRNEDLQVMHIRLGYLMTELMRKFRMTKKPLFLVVEELIISNSNQS